MKLSDRLYQRYLEELQALETFKLSHAEKYSGVLKQVMEDPHTKHLVEALAFFGARNQIQGEQTLINLYRRLFRQYFPFLWSPLPSMGIAQILPTQELNEPVICRAGTEISIENSSKRRAYFQTLHAVRLLPIRPAQAHFSFTKERGCRFFLKFTTLDPIEEGVGTFRLFLNHLNHFSSSFSFALALRQHLKRVEVCYDAPNFDTFEGEECAYDFDAEVEFQPFNHPIEVLRAKLNLPEQNLFFDLNVPSSHQKWSSFTLCFSLGRDWPKIFPLSAESFLPFVVPIVNLQHKQAELIRFDGTKDSVPILHSDPPGAYALHTITKVSSVEKHATTPIRPGVLSYEKGTYEIDVHFQEDKPAEYHLILDLEEAYRKPKLVAVDALWYQPWFDTSEKEVKAIIVNQVIRQVNVRVLGKMCSPENHSTFYDLPLLTRILALKNQTRLEADDLLFLMNILKKHRGTHFEELPNFISDVKITHHHHAFSVSSTHEYHIFLEKLDDKNRDLALLYFRYVKQVLDLWLPNIEVAVTVNAPNFNVPVTIKEGTSHETSSLVRSLRLF